MRPGDHDIGPAAATAATSDPILDVSAGVVNLLERAVTVDGQMDLRPVRLCTPVPVGRNLDRPIESVCFRAPEA